MIVFSRLCLGLAGLCLSGLLSAAQADALDQAQTVEQAHTDAAVASQQRIDRLSAHTQKLLESYRSASRHTDALKTYNQYLQGLLASQQDEQASLQQQLSQLDVTQREIVPLLLHMLDTLERFVQLDLPFLPEERRQRLAKLKAMVRQPDLTPAEKFRRLLEAYQIENEYGHTLEAYRGDLNVNGANSTVDFLRLGRLALYYQRLDGSETGYWNRAEQRWQALPGSYRNAIRQGLRIARKETAPDLLTLPLPTPEAAP